MFAAWLSLVQSPNGIFALLVQGSNCSVTMKSLESATGHLLHEHCLKTQSAGHNHVNQVASLQPHQAHAHCLLQRGNAMKVHARSPDTLI